MKTTPPLLRPEMPISGDDAIWLDNHGERLRLRYEQGKARDEMRKPGAWFRLPERERPINAMIGEWGFARLPLVNAVENFRQNPGAFVHWPCIVGLPAHHPAVLLNDPCDLVSWLIARGMANRQLQRFVKCQRDACGKFGLRERARKDTRYHSTECQEIANAESRKLGPSGAVGYVPPAR